MDTLMWFLNCMLLVAAFYGIPEAINQYRCYRTKRLLKNFIEYARENKWIEESLGYKFLEFKRRLDNDLIKKFQNRFKYDFELPETLIFYEHLMIEITKLRVVRKHNTIYYLGGIELYYIIELHDGQEGEVYRNYGNKPIKIAQIDKNNEFKSYEYSLLVKESVDKAIICMYELLEKYYNDELDNIRRLYNLNKGYTVHELREKGLAEIDRENVEYAILAEQYNNCKDDDKHKVWLKRNIEKFCKYREYLKILRSNSDLCKENASGMKYNWDWDTDRE